MGKRMTMLYYEQGQLYMEDQCLSHLASDLGTPFFLVSERCLHNNYNYLLRGLSSTGVETVIRYCAKTNNEKGVLSILASLGSQVLTSHFGEVQLVLESGFSPDKISFQRPVLQEREVCAVLDAGVTLFQIHDFQDITTIERAASACSKKARVSLRLRNDSHFFSRRLGFRSADIIRAADYLQKSAHLILTGLNFYGGTQQEDARALFKPLRKMIFLAAEISSRSGVLPEEINIGGGIPSSSLLRNRAGRLPMRLRDENSSNPAPEYLENYGKVISERFVEECYRAGLNPPPAFIVEPGRAIVGNAVLLITRICAIRGKWLFVDASRNHLGESFLLFSRRIIPATQTENPVRRIYHVSGNTLNTMDVIDVYRRLPPVAKEDVLVFCDAGAYTISRAARYAGFSPAVYLLREDGSLHRIRNAENLSDLMRPMCLFQDGKGSR